jgi:hypothetical protein
MGRSSCAPFPLLPDLFRFSYTQANHRVIAIAAAIAKPIPAQPPPLMPLFDGVLVVVEVAVETVIGGEAGIGVVVWEATANGLDTICKVVMEAAIGEAMV